MSEPPLTPELLLQAYCNGIFPMAEGRNQDEVFWVDPTRRGIIPLDAFHISRSLRRALLRQNYQITVDRDFAGVVQGCADRDETWINARILNVYMAVFDAGYARSLEVWRDGALIGGVYGVAIGGAFFGESMFSRATDASKIALAYLMDRLKIGRFQLFDTQFLTPHLASLGAVEISRAEYHKRLQAALKLDADFLKQDGAPAAQDVIQRNAQTS
ncbi:leucyl/phenylalanyl-tRNA--protein transferase [Pseudaestuariivita rosea]|uniref:leucyl/phenylalanyl-tRNA--protein transferase n=1 Tax=Pseudaestuariivita rosea TaxID=2763263 RepID=UPI001ABAD4AD|nr:leucyl/phenylalanyl-tRNA--protein transferase [Pseudaestuariivita rosea]